MKLTKFRNRPKKTSVSKMQFELGPQTRITFDSSEVEKRTEGKEHQVTRSSFNLEYGTRLQVFF